MLKTPIGVGYATCPGSRMVAVTSAPVNPGLGINLTGAWEAIQGVVGPATTAGLDAFNRSIMSAVAERPEVQSAAKDVAKAKAASLFQQATPLILIGLLGALILKGR